MYSIAAQYDLVVDANKMVIEIVDVFGTKSVTNDAERAIEEIVRTGIAVDDYVSPNYILNKAPSGNVLCVRKRFGAFFNRSFSSMGTDLGGLGSKGCVDQCRQQGGKPKATDHKGELGPVGLFLSRFHRTPLYAEIGLLSILGTLTGIGLNEGVRRGGSSGWWCIVGGVGSYLLGILAIFLIG